MMGSETNSEQLQESPLSRFKAKLSQSEAFVMLYQKIKDNTVSKSNEEYHKIVENMSKMIGFSRE